LITTIKRAFGIVRIQTNDTLILGSEEFDTIKDNELTKAKFSAKPKELLSLETLLIFNGCIFTQKEGDVAVELRQKKQGKKLKTVDSKAKDH
jgi:hypothetical protein